MRETRSQSRSTRIFLLIWGLSLLAMTWPLLQFFEEPFPLVLGMPPAMAWILAWLTILFLGMVWKFWIDRKNGEGWEE